MAKKADVVKDVVITTIPSQHYVHVEGVTPRGRLFVRGYFNLDGVKFRGDVNDIIAHLRKQEMAFKFVSADEIPPETEHTHLFAV